MNEREDSPLSIYIRDWARIIYDATGDQTKVDRAIVLADLNGMFDPVKVAELSQLAAPAQTAIWRTDINNAPQDQTLDFYLDWADDCAPINPPMASDAPHRRFRGKKRSWASIYKATHWMPLCAFPSTDRIGEFVADYSPLSAEDIAKEDHELTKLHARSGPVSSTEGK